MATDKTDPPEPEGPESETPQAPEATEEQPSSQEPSEDNIEAASPPDNDSDADADDAAEVDPDRPVPDGGVFGAIGAPPILLSEQAPSASFSGAEAAAAAPEPSRTVSPFRQAGRRMRLRISGLTGWMRYGLGLLAGLLTGLTMAPFHILPLLPLAFVTLVWLMDGLDQGGRGRRQAFALGWWFGFPFFLTGFYWVAFAFLVEADAYAWMIPFAMTALPAGLALFTGAALWLARLLWRPGAARILVFALAFAIFELLRGNLFTGLPWNLIGYAWGSVPDVLQVTSVIGIYGLSFLTVLTATSPAALFAHQTETTNWRWPFFAVALIGLIWGAGAVRLYVAPTGPSSYVEGVNLRIVQPNIPQADKWLPENREVIWERLLAQTAAPSSAPITHVIWPEAAPPFALAQATTARRQLAEAMDGSVLVTGAMRVEQTSSGVPRFYNSLHVLAPDGAIVGTYDKHHLVPFGEYLPFRAILERFGFQSLVAQRLDYRAGNGPRTLSVPGAPDVGPLVCYEAVFPGQIIDPARRPDWLVQVTDDSWFGDSTGPRQHLGISRVRAIEEGLPLVRAANTGISTVIDPYGRTLGALPLNQAGVLDSPLPAAGPITPYARFGDWPLIGLLLVLGVYSWRRRQNR